MQNILCHDIPKFVCDNFNIICMPIICAKIIQNHASASHLICICLDFYLNKIEIEIEIETQKAR